MVRQRPRSENNVIASAAICPTPTSLSHHCRHMMFKTSPFTPPHHNMTIDNIFLVYDVLKAFAITTGGQGHTTKGLQTITPTGYPNTCSHRRSYYHCNIWETTYTGITGSSRLSSGTQRPDFPTICGHPKTPATPTLGRQPERVTAEGTPSTTTRIHHPRNGTAATYLHQIRHLLTGGPEIPPM